MTIEASDVIEPLRALGRPDMWRRGRVGRPRRHTGHRVCHEASASLAAEKARLARVVEEMLAAVPAGAIVRDADDQTPYGSDHPAPRCA